MTMAKSTMTMTKSTMTITKSNDEAQPSRTVCPNCGGNGYTETPHAIYADQFDIRQCERCSSEGETDAEI